MTLKASDQLDLLNKTDKYKDLSQDEAEHLCFEAGILDDIEAWHLDGGYTIWKDTSLASDENGLYLRVTVEIGDETNGDGSDRDILVRVKEAKTRYSFG